MVRASQARRKVSDRVLPAPKTPARVDLPGEPALGWRPSRQCFHHLAGRLCLGQRQNQPLEDSAECTTRSQQLEKGMQALQQDCCRFRLIRNALGQGFPTQWVCVLPPGWPFAAGGQDTRNLFAPGSSTHRLGGMRLPPFQGHRATPLVGGASPGSGTKSSGKRTKATPQ